MILRYCMALMSYLWTDKADELHDAAHEVLVFARVGHVEGVKEFSKEMRQEGADVGHRKSGLAILLQGHGGQRQDVSDGQYISMH